ncbi:MAG: hypothetical protein QG675_426 [Patescibacteria group bacterium]|nr:hypothetical protein [Patescibacteria group bacterium]
MVDTIKLLIRIYDPLLLDGSKFAPITLEQLVNSKPGTRTYLNPSPMYKRLNKYMPRLTMHKRFSKGEPTFHLAVEFSAPKLLFDSNFDELVEADFESLVTALQEKLFELVGSRFSKRQLAEADIGTWHPSKNIIFLDYTSCQTVLNTISKLDFSRVYDLQKTDFRDGHVVHVHCNSLDIAFYDKLADLRQAKKSEKRAIEKDSYLQLNLLDQLEEYRPIEVFRYEVRFVGRASVKRAYPELDKWTFETMFKRKLCQAALVKHWQKISDTIDMLALDVNKPYELLQNYLTDNPNVTPQAAMAAVTGLLINGQEGVVSLRGIIVAHFGIQAWYRIKKTLKAPNANRYEAFVRIDEALEKFEPTEMKSFIKTIENTIK